MPTRLIREGILDSAVVNLLGDSEEVFYRRLMSIVDDYGRYEARTDLLRAKLFGLRLEDWPTEKVEKALNRCEMVSLVTTYEVGGKKYLEINNFGQRARTKSKFPSPPAANCGRLRADDSRCPPYSETEAYSETETKAETDCDWSPFPDAEFALNSILDTYPQETGKTSARGYWREFLDKAQVNAPRQARAMLAAARLIRERCPPDKIQFLPNARKFIAESWADNWERISEQWQTPQKEGSMSAIMRAIEEAKKA